MIETNESVKNFFNGKNIEVPREWIAACIDWLQSEHARQPSNVHDTGWLAQKAYEQWQFTDLTELGCGCLPPGLSDLISGVLDKDYVLQINSLREVGLPAYSQLQQLRKDDLGNSLIDTDKPKQQSWEPKPSRLLLLAVTDGVTQLQAMEYTPIPVLSLHTKPGTKVLVRGGVAVRRGVLLLTAAHVTVLGGAVDALLAPNAPENIINRALGLEETETPHEYEDPPLPPATLPPSQASQYYPGTQPPTQLAAVRNGVSGRNAVPSRNSVPTRNALPASNAIPTVNGNNPTSQNSSMNRNNFSNLWNNSQAFGRPADQRAADPIAAFDDDDDDDFLGMDVEAALMEAETQLCAGASASNSSSTKNSVAARGSNVLGRAGPSTTQLSRNGRNVLSNVTRGAHSSASSNVNSRAGMSIDLSKNTLAANSSLLNKPQNNPFIDSHFPDDCFGDEDLGAIEEEVRLIESQENRPIINSSQSSMNQTDIVSGISNSDKNTAQRSSTFQKPPPKHVQQLNIRVNSSIMSPLKTASSSSNSNDGVGSNRNSSEVNDNPSDNRPSGKRPSTAASDHEPEKSSKQVKLNNNENVSSLSNKIKAMVQGESSTSETTMASSSAGPPPKGIASLSVAASKSSSITRETARVSPLSHPEGTSPSTVGGVPKGDPVTTAVKTKPPFTYLCFLPNKCSVEQEFIVKGFVMTLVSRLDPSSGQWRLPVKINDGSCSLDVDIHDQVLQKLIGMSVPEMRAYKAIASADPSVRGMLAKSVSGCQKELISLCCLLTVRVSPATPRPTLVALSPLQDCHAHQLADRALTS